VKRSRKSILVFCPYYPPHVGGLESHADEFNKYLSKKGYRIVVFTPRLPESSPEVELVHEVVKILRYPAWEIIPNYPLPRFWSLRFWKMWIGVCNLKFDWVISRTRFFNTTLMALFYSKMQNIKWMHIEHGSDFVKLNNTLISVMARLYDQTVGFLVIRIADKVVANSIASAKFCKEISGRNCEVIYRGVEVERIKAIKPDVEIKKKYSDKYIVLFAGRLIDGKGVGDLIKAINQIKTVNLVLMIVGDGPKKKELENMADDRTVFLGQKNNEELIGIMKVSDLVVNPSYTEGLPTSMIEALVCKKPVIATDVGGTREIVNEGMTGYLVSPKNVTDLAKKIEFCMNTKLVVSASPNNFDWNMSINKYIRLLN